MDRTPKKETRMFIISPQELAELGLFQDLTDSEPAGPSKEAPLILNEQVSKLTNPNSSIKLEKVRNPNIFKKVLHSKMMGSGVTFNTQKLEINAPIKKKQTNILSPEAFLVKDILLSAARASKKEETISKPEEKTSESEKSNCHEMEENCVQNMEVIDVELVANMNSESKQKDTTTTTRKEVKILSNKSINLSSEEIKQLVTFTNKQSTIFLRKDKKLNLGDKTENAFSDTPVLENISKNRILNVNEDSVIKKPTKLNNPLEIIRPNNMEYPRINKGVTKSEIISNPLEKSEIWNLKSVFKHENSNLNKPNPVDDVINISTTEEKKEQLKVTTDDENEIVIFISKVENKIPKKSNTDVSESNMVIEEFTEICETVKSNDIKNSALPVQVKPKLKPIQTEAKLKLNNDKVSLQSSSKFRKNLLNLNKDDNIEIPKSFEIAQKKEHEIETSHLTIQRVSIKVKTQSKNDEASLQLPIKVDRSTKGQLKVNENDNVEILESFETVEKTENDQKNCTLPIQGELKPYSIKMKDQLNNDEISLHSSIKDNLKTKDITENFDSFKIVKKIECVANSSMSIQSESKPVPMEVDMKSNNDKTLLQSPFRVAKFEENQLKVKDTIEIFESFDNVKKIKNVPSPIQSKSKPDPIEVEMKSDNDDISLQSPIKVGRSRKDQQIVNEDDDIEIFESFETVKQTRNEDIEKMDTTPGFEANVAIVNKSKNLGRPRKDILKVRSNRSPTSSGEIINKTENLDAKHDSTVTLTLKKQGRPRKDTLHVNPNDDIEVFESFENVDRIMNENNVQMDVTDNLTAEIKDSSKDKAIETQPAKNETQKTRKVGRPRKNPIKVNKDDSIDIFELYPSTDKREEISYGEKTSIIQKPRKVGRPRKYPQKTHTDVINEAEGSHIDDTLENPQVSVFKKKAGRPRKDSKRGRKSKQVSVDNHNTIMETSLEIFEEKIQELNTSLDPINDKDENSPLSAKVPLEQEKTSKSAVETPIVRKRGRPRKNVAKPNNESAKCSLTSEDLESFTKAGVFVDAEMEISKSGRRRKKINYFDMENSFMDDDLPRPYKRAKSSQDYNSDDDNEKNTLKLQTLTEESTTDILKEELTTLKDEDEKNMTKSPEREKRYKYTGETTRMMQSIFSLAFKTSTPKKETAETSDVVSAESTEQLLRPATSKRGRKKLDESNKNIVIDEDGRVTCASCREKVPDNNWNSHKRYVHYNLSWREGDQFLNVDDDIFLKRTLKPILQEDKKLVCYKCNNSFTTIPDYITHKEECEGIVLGGKVTCAVCEEQMEKTKWAFHKRRKHNNLTWRIGDPPLNLGDQTLVLDILNGLYRNKIPLHCYKCNTAKKSVVGFLSHQAQCGLASEDVKVKCDYCDRKVLPVSMACHIKLVHKSNKEITPRQSPNSFDTSEEPLSKRRAAKNALAWFVKGKNVQEESQYFSDQTTFKDNDLIIPVLKKALDDLKLVQCKFENCTFVTSELNRLLEHLDICEQKPEEYFTCLKCCMIFLTSEEVKKHLYDIHDVYLPSDGDMDDSDYDDEQYFRDKELIKIRRQEKVKVMMGNKTKMKPRFISNLVTHTKKLFPCAFEYTLEFCNEHYTQSVLFDNMRYSRLEWNLLQETFLMNYLPKTEESCQAARIRVKDFENVLGKEHDFKTYELFEVEQEEGVMTIFCGGPVFAMAWLPTPHILLRCNQILAVAVGNSFDSTYLTNTNYSEPSVIQFWDCGVLKNKKTPRLPSLHCCLAVDNGPIWHLECCPSGGYDENAPSSKEQLQRLGLLAVAGSSSIVCIYAIPFLDEEEKGLVYKSKPLVKLRITLVEDTLRQKHFPTKISWGKASGHKYIAVGYSDGMVAMFDLKTKSKALRFKDEQGIDNLLPYKTIKAHLHYISVLSLIHHGNGRRWLLTGSIDCTVTMWDLISDTKVTVNKKKMISDGTWLTNWLAYVTASDESNTNNVAVNSSILPHRSYLYEPITIGYSPTTISSISVSDWLNGIIQGNTMGEIISVFPHQLLYSVDSYKKMKAHRFCLGFAKLIDKNKSPEERVAEEKKKQKALQHVPKGKDNPNLDSAAAIFGKHRDVYSEHEPGNYPEATKKYGLVFCDMALNSFNDFSESLQDKLQNHVKVLEVSKPHLYPLQKINKICLNPNCQASLYYATGYQTGFVRITYMKFLENDRQVV